MDSKELKKLRLSLNLSQEEFGKKLGFRKSSISNMENGTRKISSKTANLIKLVFTKNDFQKTNDFIKIICYIQQNFNSNNLFDLIMKDNDSENIYLCWKNTKDVFATIYISVIKKIIEEGW